MINPVDKVLDELALMSTGLVVPELPRFTVGLDTHLNELKMKLLKDGVSMLVLTAPGGCGKTTLANMLYHDQDVKGKFDKNIFFVNVSTKKSNYIVVQELCQLMGSKEADFPNEDIAFNCLQELMEEKRPDPLFLILDDVWPKSESLLEKFNDVTIQSNCNILVTSRSSFPRFGSPYPLVALNEKDAMTLFRHSAFRGDESYDVPEDLQDKIVRRCKGCPLAIKVVGKSLRGERTESWLKRERELSKGASIFDIETEVQVLLCLKSSLDALDEKDQTIKECFLDLGAFPEDQRIPATALIDMWAELYGLDADFLSIDYLQQLSTRSLANLVITRKEAMEADGYYSEHFVSQHDVLRDLAVFQAKLDPNKTRLIIDKCEGNVCKSLTEQKHQSTRILSISYDGVLSTKLHNIQLAEVEVLVLNFQTKKYAFPEFVAEMANLKVLIVTSHGFLPAELSNFQVLGLLPNLKRIRLERISIASIAKNRVELKSVKKISLFLCSIGQVFTNSSFQISDAFPNLVELNIDYCSDLVELPVDLCDLIHLKTLSITHCHKLSALPSEIGKLINLEVLRLKSCTDLVTFPASTKDLEKLSFLDISDCFSIKELPYDIGEISTLKKINMRQCSRVEELPVSVLNLEQLQEVICDEETKGSWELFNLNIKIRVLKEDFNLNWLPKYHSV
ncbi:hypothetical protein M0R45_004383 [Rubus argutus]|uniref:NB-ARC domain-containing protein n=1 Tax=Rubus argutus TaxID=59490 RepID=A0AAW1YJN0_RUBAR